MKTFSKRSAAFITAFILCGAACGQESVCRQIADAGTMSVRDFAGSVMQKLPDQSGTMFETLCYSKRQNTLLRDGEAVSGNSFSGFRVMDGELRIAAAETVRSGETAEAEYLSLEEAAPLIGLETHETAEGVYVSDPFRSGTLIVKSEKLPDTNGAAELGSGWSDLHVLQYPTAADAYAAYQAFQTDADVAFAEPNRIYHIEDADYSFADAAEADSAYEFPADNWGWEAVGADRFLTQNRESLESAPQIVAAVIDTGLYSGHIWFRNRIAEGGTSLITENQSGYEDLHGHGTHCAGIICGMTAENVRILPIKVINEQGYGNSLSIFCGMYYAAEQNADVVSISLGGFGTSPMYDEAVRLLRDHDIPCVVAAGNDADDAKYYTPANVPEAITVSSISHMPEPWLSDEEQLKNHDGSYWLSSFSNYGKYIDFAAPGAQINSAYLDSADSIAEMSGTSMATPHVTGCVADILSLIPDASVDDVYGYLKAGACDLGDEGFDEKYGWGMVSLADFDAEISSLAKPEASCSSGVFTKVFSVTLSTPEPDAEIRYTLDGTNPDVDTGILYQGEEILIDDQTDLTAVTVKDGARSSRAYWHYKLYNDPPTVTPSGGEYSGSVSVNIFGTRNKDVYYTLDGSDPGPENGTKYTGSFEITETTLMKAAVVIGKYVSEPTVRYYVIDGQKTGAMFAAKDGVLTDYYGSESELDLRDYFAPGEITAIGEGVFQGNETLQSIILPDSVVSIGANAFQLCTYLYKISAPGAETVGPHSFEKTNVSEINMPALQTIGEFAFASAFPYTDDGTLFPADNQIREIGAGAFEYSTLEHIELPNLKSLGEGAFKFCNFLKTVRLSPDIKVLPARAFEICFRLVSLDAPGVTELGDHALYGENGLDANLKDCTIDFSKVTAIGAEALSLFRKQPQTESVSFDALTEIGKDAFANFPVKELYLPALKHIPTHAFWNSVCSAVFLAQAETLDTDALTLNPIWGNHTVYVFGSAVSKDQKNPLCAGCDTIVIAAPADSPMKQFALRSETAFCSSPGFYVPSGFTSCKRYDIVSLGDCIPLVYGCKAVWSVAETAYDAGYQAPEQPLLCNDAGVPVSLDTSVPGTVTLCADLVGDSDAVLATEMLTFSIAPEESEDLVTKEGVFILERSQGDVHQYINEYMLAASQISCKNSFLFRPEQEGDYYFIPENCFTNVYVYDNRNELCTYTKRLDISDDLTAEPVHLEAGASYRVQAEIRAENMSDEQYAGIQYAGILISRQKPGNVLEICCSVEPAQNMYEKGTVIPNRPAVTVTGALITGSGEYTGQKRLTENVDYQTFYVRKGNYIEVYVFGMGELYGAVRVPIYVYEEYTLGDTLSISEIAPGETLCYHISGPEENGSFVIGADFSESALRKFASGIPDNDPFSYPLCMHLYDSEMCYVPFENKMYYMLQENLYQLKAGEEYYLMLSIVPNDESDDAPGVPDGVYELCSRGFDRNGWIFNSEFDCCELIGYSGSELNLIRKITDPAGNTLEENKDYQVYMPNNTIPGLAKYIIKGIGDYFGCVTLSSEIYDTSAEEGPFAPEQIRVGEPFRVTQTGGIFELQTEDSCVCKLRKTDPADPDTSCIYSVAAYDPELFSWVTLCSVYPAGEDAELHLQPGYYHIYIAQSAPDQEYILDVQETVNSIYKADVQTKTLYYTGEELAPEITLTYDGTILTEGEDYVIAGSERPIIECGFYGVTIRGIGSFCAERTVQVAVKENEEAVLPAAQSGSNLLSVTAPRQTAGCEWIPDDTNYGIRMNELKIASLVIYDAETNTEAVNLNGQGYLYDFFEVTPGRKYRICASWADPEQTGDIAFTLLSDYTDLSRCITEGNVQAVFTESGTVPEFTVKDGENVLQKGTDYDIYYSGGNHEAGHAVVSLIGTGTCIGELRYHYYLSPVLNPDDFEQDEATVKLTLNEASNQCIMISGDMQRFVFEAPADGRFRLERPDPKYYGVCVFAYGADGKLLPLDAGYADLKAGEKLWFIAVYDHLDQYLNPNGDYSIAVYSAEQTYSLCVDDSVYLIRDGAAYLERYEGGNTGIQLPETVYDPERDLEIPVKGLTPELTAAIGSSKTIYCEQDCAGYAQMLEAGLCVAVPEPQTGIRGDITGDGIVNINDWLTLMRWISECPGMLMSETAYAVSDYNEDGCLDMSDADALRKAIC